MSSDLPPWYRDNVVVNLAFLKVRVDSHEFDILGTVFESATMLDDLL